jgi:hypothetical protein
MSEWYLKDGVFGPHDAPVPVPETAVRTTPQTFSDTEKAQARQNIGAGTGGGGGGDLTGAVRYDVAQTLTSPQKTQARENVGAAPQSAFESLAVVATTGSYDDLTDKPATSAVVLSTWEAGKRYYQDTGLNTPAVAIGDPVNAWVSTTGEVLTSVNGTPRLTSFNGLLVPACDGVEFQHFVSPAKNLRDVEVHGVFAQTEGGRGLSITAATAFSTFGVRSVGFDIGISSAPGTTGRGAISSVSMLGVVGFADKQRIFLNGGEVSASGSIDFPAPQEATVPIQILGTWSHEASATPAAIIRLTICARLTDAQRSALMAEHRAFLPDRKRRIAVMHDSIFATTRDGAYFIPHGSVNEILRIKYDPICVGVAGATFTTCSQYSTSWPSQVLGDGHGPVDVIISTSNEFPYVGSGVTHAADVAAFVAAQKTAGVIGKAIWVCPYYRTTGDTTTFAAQVDIAYAALSVSAVIDQVVDLRGVIIASNGLADDGIHVTRLGAANISDRILHAIFVARGWAR